MSVTPALRRSLVCEQHTFSFCSLQGLENGGGGRIAIVFDTRYYANFYKPPFSSLYAYPRGQDIYLIFVSPSIDFDPCLAYEIYILHYAFAEI